MPFYAFICRDCLKIHELRRSIADRDQSAPCPLCSSANTLRMLSTPMVFSEGEGGRMQAVGGSGCGSCTATTCSSCR